VTGVRETAITEFSKGWIANNQEPTAASTSRAPRPVYIFVTGIWGAKYNSEFRYGGWKFPKLARPEAKYLQGSAGTFQFGADFYQPNARITLSATGSELQLKWPSGDSSPLIPLDQDRFMDRSYWQEIKLGGNQRSNGTRPASRLQLSMIGFVEAQLSHDHSVVVRTRAEHVRTFSDIYNRKL
jgi:hypothetical protein